MNSSEKPFNGSELITYDEVMRTGYGVTRGQKEKDPQPLKERTIARVWTPKEITHAEVRGRRETDLRGVAIEATYEKSLLHAETWEERSYAGTKLWVAYIKDLHDQIFKVLIEGYESYKNVGSKLSCRGTPALTEFYDRSHDFGETDTSHIRAARKVWRIFKKSSWLSTSGSAWPSVC